MLADTFNYITPYNYTENSPVAFIDLWGTQKWKVSINNEMNRLEVYLADIDYSPLTAVWDDKYQGKMICEPSQISTIKPYINPNNYRYNADGSFYFKYDKSSPEVIIKPNYQAILYENKDLTPQWSSNVPIGNVEFGGYRLFNAKNDNEILNSIGLQSGIDIENVNRKDVYVSSDLRKDFTERFTPMLQKNYGGNWQDKINLNFLSHPTKEGANLEIIYKKEINSVNDYFQN